MGFLYISSSSYYSVNNSQIDVKNSSSSNCMELEGSFDSLSVCWEQWPCSSFSSWFGANRLSC